MWLPDIMMKFVALLAIFALAQAQDKFYFNTDKCNNDWDNSDNWEGAQPSEDVATVVMYADQAGGPRRPVRTLVPEDTKALLAEVVLSDDMMIEFGDSVEWTFVEDTEGLAEVADFVGGQKYSRKCDVSCHENLLLENGEQALRPFCQGDIFSVDTDHSVVLFNAEDMNVDELHFGNQIVTEKKDIPPWFFSTNNVDVFFDSQGCREAGHLNNVGKCRCYTSCPSFDDLMSQNAEIRGNAKNQANKDLETRNKESINPFDVKILHSAVDLSSCSTCPQWEDAMRCVVENDSAKAALEAAVRAKASDFFDNFVIEFASMEVTSSYVHITGTFTAPEKIFWVGAPNAVGSVKWWREDATVPTAPSQDRFLLALYDAVVTAGKACQSAETATALSFQKDSCNNDACGICTIAEKLQDTLSEEPVLRDLIYGLGDLNISGVKDLLTFKEDVDNATKDEIASSMLDFHDECIDVPTPDPDATTEENATTPTPINFEQLVMDFILAREAQEDMQMAFEEINVPPPATVEFDLTFLPVAKPLPVHDLNFLVDENNKDDLEFTLAAQLAEEAFVDEIKTVTVSLVDMARRRAADPDATPKEMKVHINGTGYGDFSRGSIIHKDLVALVNDIVTSFEIETHHKCFDLNTGTDPACMAEEVKAAVMAALEDNPDLSAEEITKVARNAALAVVGCGVEGPDPDTGACKNPEAANTVIQGDEIAAAVAAASADAKKEFDASRATPAPEGNIIPIAAGAGAGALVLIIIIVVVVMRNKGESSGPKPAKTPASTSDRTVVAFENPMYDDPGSSPAAVYDNGPEVDEGLYDEPAFNQAEEKSNPMYQSNENIADVEAEEEGGYLDVAPEDEVGGDE